MEFSGAIAIRWGRGHPSRAEACAALTLDDERAPTREERARQL